MTSLETYDGTISTSVNALVATTVGLEQSQGGLNEEENSAGGGPTGGGRAMAGSGVEGVIISGHEDCYIRFFDANSGKFTARSFSFLVSVFSNETKSVDRPMHVQHGSSPSIDFESLAQPRWARAR